MRRIAFAGAALLALAAPAFGATYSGVAPDPAVVWVTEAVPPAPATGVEIHQTMRSFVPDLVVIPVGTAVLFPNDDPFYHNVYSDSPGNAFDIGLYDTGPGKSVPFTTPGIVDVRCHVHGSMHATIVVVDGPFARTTTPNERYTLDGLTPGRHTLHVWTGGDAVVDSPIVVR